MNDETKALKIALTILLQELSNKSQLPPEFKTALTKKIDGIDSTGNDSTLVRILREYLV